MRFLEPPGMSQGQRSNSQTNFIIEEDSRSDISDFPSTNNDDEEGRRGFTLYLLSHPLILKISMATLIFIIFVLIGFSSVVGYFYFQSIPPHAICKTRQCTRTATLLIRTMDESIDPCEDFHKFACGNWISDTAAVVSVSVYDHTTIMRDRIVGRLRSLTENITNRDIEALQQVRIMYNTCVDLATIENEGLQPIVDLIIKLINPKKNSVAKTLALIHRETGQDYIFDMIIEPSFRNTSLRIISIDQPEQPLSKATFMYSPEIVKAYERLIEKVLTRVAKEIGLKTEYLNDMKKAAKKISAFEQLFAMATSEIESKPGQSNLLSLKEIQRLFSNNNSGVFNSNATVNEFKKQFNWTEYVEALFEGLNEEVKITQDFLLNVNDLEYLRRVGDVLTRTKQEQIYMYLTWQLLYTFGKDVTKELRDYFTAFSAIAEGTESTPNRHTECILLLDQSLPFALTHKYVMKYVKDETIEEASEMFSNILKSFKSQVGTLDWMDETTRHRAILKANKVEGFIGYPKWLKEPKKVDFYHKGLKFENESFFRNVLRMMKWISEKELKEFNLKVDRSWTSDSPAQADAFYDDERNAVTFPAGFIQEPFIGMGLRAIDYGALGSVIGHELTHGFDTQGRYSDEEGRLDSWWSLDTLRYFLNKAECFENQYGRFWLPELGPSPGPNNTVNGKRTLAENIADNGGVREALQAYKYYVKKRGSPEPRLPGLEKYSPEQLFFLSFAQSWCSYLSPSAMKDMVETNVHSPPRFRIIAPLANFNEFSNVWQCKKGQEMNPTHKCVLWG